MAPPSSDAPSNDDVQLQCRACSNFGADYELVALFGGVGQLARIYATCTGLACTAGDCLPAHLCAGCNAKLVAFNKFRQRCAQWDEHFRAELAPQQQQQQQKQQHPEQPTEAEVHAHERDNESTAAELHAKRESRLTDIEKEGDDDDDNYDEFELDEHHEENDDNDDDPDLDTTTHVYDIEVLPDDHATATVADHDIDDDRDDPDDAHNELYEEQVMYSDETTAPEFLDTHTRTPSPTGTATDTIASATTAIPNSHPRTDDLTTIVYHCDLCPARFYKKHRLEQHLFEQHTRPQAPDNRRHVCAHNGCPKTYASRTALNAHRRKVHDDDDNDDDGDNDDDNNDDGVSSIAANPSKRIKVEAGTSTDPDISRATAGRRFVCDQCGKMFSSKGALKKHSYVHSDAELPFGCTLCPKRYVTKHKLKEHTMRHEGVKNYICPYCGMRKTTTHELKVHINYHTREKKWQCGQCPMSFTSIGNMSRHVRIVHDGVKAFACTFCERSFGKAETLKHHVMTHTGERPHGCDLCGKRFIQLVALQAHKRSHRKRSTRPDADGADGRAAAAAPDDMTVEERLEEMFE